jgi:hypothetical protein
VRAAFQNQRQDERANKVGDNRVVNVRVGGNAIEVMRGEVFL